MSNSIAKFYVAGVQFHELKSISDKIEPGANLQLVQEPTNQYDPNAVRIEFMNFMLGYVPKKFSAMVAGYMTVETVTCTVIAIDMKRKTYEQLEVELTVED
jgi:hypothetical protein